VLLAIDLHEDPVDEQGVAIASVLSFQSSGGNGAVFYTSEANRFAADSDTAFNQDIFDILVAEIETIVEPNCVGNDIGWGRLAKIYSVYKYSFTDSSNFDHLTCRYQF
jgi:hypothetical protein